MRKEEPVFKRKQIDGLQQGKRQEVGTAVL